MTQDRVTPSLISTYVHLREEHVQLNTPGEFVMVPRGVWHTARIATRASMLFITPGEGTENRPIVGVVGVVRVVR